MLIQYASDLHLEFQDNKEFLAKKPLQPEAGILLLAGDIVQFALMDEVEDFFNYISDNFKTTYWVPGNHEYYNFDAAKKTGTLNEKIRENIFLVNNASIKIEDVQFIFSTLWTKIGPTRHYAIERGMNDFRLIKYGYEHFSASHFNQLHEDSLAFIKQELDNHRAGKTVVVSHHVPTFLNYPPLYKGNVLSEAFAVELFDLIKKQGPDYWIYGHHHHNGPEFKIGKTTLLTNQLGYVKYNEHQLFNPHKIFSI